MNRPSESSGKNFSHLAMFSHRHLEAMAKERGVAAEKQAANHMVANHLVANSPVAKHLVANQLLASQL